MKFPLPIIVLGGLAGIAVAEVPRKVPLQSYSTLWNNSPFTSKPPPPPPGEVKNALEDYALIGVSPVGASNNYRVTLINKKKPEERIMVFSDGKKPDFKILGVTRKPGDPLGTVVSMQAGSATGTVSYDEKLLTLTPPAATPPQPQAGQPPIPGQAVPPGQNQGQNQGQARQPRPRVVPPPTPATTQQAQPVQQQQQRSPRRRP